jgi:hypothetical protein
MIGHVVQGWRIHMHLRHVYLPANKVPGVRKEWGSDGKCVEDGKDMQEIRISYLNSKFRDLFEWESLKVQIM